jgi:hypothetical protein
MISQPVFPKGETHTSPGCNPGNSKPTQSPRSEGTPYNLESEGSVRGLRVSRKDAETPRFYYVSLFAIELVPSLRLGVLSEAGVTIITIPTPDSAPHAPTGLSELLYAHRKSLPAYSGADGLW